MKLAYIKTYLNPVLIIAGLFITSCNKNNDVEPDQQNANLGCIDPYAMNYDANAVYSDNSCEYESIACSLCDYILESGTYIADNNELNLPAGSLIGIEGGERGAVSIDNFKGSEGKPFIFTNCDGKLIIDAGSGEAIRIRNSEYLRVSGTGSADQFGIQIVSGGHGLRAYERVNDIEMDHIEVSGVGIGLWAVTRPECDGSVNRGNYVQKNTIIHHNYIHDVHGEGMYIGGSKWNGSFSNNGCPGEALYQADVTGVKIYNNLVENAGWDGIQVGGAVEDCEVYNNVIRNYGTEMVEIHQAGIMINPGTVGAFYANLIENGNGNAIHALGFDNLIHSNVIIDTEQNGIHTGDRGPLPNQSYRIVNNTIMNVKGQALYFNSSESVDNIFVNNFMYDIANEDFFTKSNIEVVNNIMTSSLDGFPFENPDLYNYTPTPESALIDSGQVFSRDEIKVDFLLRERIAGEKIDIGAYENQNQ